MAYVADYTSIYNNYDAIRQQWVLGNYIWNALKDIPKNQTKKANAKFRLDLTAELLNKVYFEVTGTTIPDITIVVILPSQHIIVNALGEHRINTYLNHANEAVTVANNILRGLL